MFLKKLDWISPSITLYFKGEKSHVSIYSGILSIISYIIVLLISANYIIAFIKRENPKAYFFTRYIEDAGTFPLNATKMFHFIQVTDPDTNQKAPLDFEAFRIVGFDNVYPDDYMNNPSKLKTENHWVYGNCNNISDTQGISYLITQNYYEQSACIRKYFDAEKQRYFNTEEEGFKWPVIIKGCSNSERNYYGIIMQRCDKADDFLKQQGPNCKSTSEIDNIIKNVSLDFQLLDYYADMLNYKKPLTKFFYSITSGILKDDYIIQNLNFNPVQMITHNGIVFDNIIKEDAYFFIQNEKMSLTEQELNNKNQTTNGCLIGIYFWMQNNLQYYERHFDRIQNLLSQIGGINNIVITIVSILNLLIYNFIVILDTEELVLNYEKDIFPEFQKKPTILRNINKVNFPPKKPFKIREQSPKEIRQLQLSNNQRLMKSGEEVSSNKITDEDNMSQDKNKYVKKKILFNYKNNNDGNVNSKDLKCPIAFSRIRNENDQKNKTGKISSKKKEEYENRPLEKQNLNWCNYLGYSICCKRSDNKLIYYEDFRAKLISEENIIQNYMDIYKILKM